MQNLMPTINTSDGVFHDGDPTTGELGTPVTSEYMNNVQSAIRNAQSELISVLSAASIAPNAGAGQLLAALRILFPAASAFGASLAGAGWQKLPSGLIIQWGIVSGTSGRISGTYPIAFPNAVLQVTASLADKTSGVTAGISLYVNNETFADKGVLTMRPIGSDGAGSTAVRFIAIGY